MSNENIYNSCNTNLYNSLRIPDAIKDLPRYDGNRHTLFDFIENIQEILGMCNEVDGEPCSKILLRAIRNKIVGEANEVLNMYGTPLEWESIRDNLTTHYADKRNEPNLIKDLHNITQGNDVVEKYFSKIIDIQSTIINHIKLNETNNIIIRAKKDLYQEMCLSTFLAGLREPLGSMVRAMQPISIQEAFQYCLKEQNIQYSKKSNYQPPLIRKPFQPFQPSLPIYKFQPSLPIHKFQPPLPPKPFQSFQIPYQPRFQNNNRPQYFNHKPFNNNSNLPPRNNFQQPFSNPNLPFRNNFQQPFQNTNLPPRNNPQQNFNKPQIPIRKYEPMDTTSNMNKHTQPTYHQHTISC